MDFILFGFIYLIFGVICVFRLIIKVSESKTIVRRSIIGNTEKDVCKSCYREYKINKILK